MAAVLILEDDVDCGELLCEILSLSRHECMTVSSLEELQRRQREVLACDLAVLDINLGPGDASGVDACRWLLRHGFRGTIVFLTGHGASHPLVMEAARMAKAQVLTKPISAGRLVELAQEIG